MKGALAPFFMPGKFTYFCRMQSSFSIEQSLSNLQIEALNEIQQASLEANKNSNAVVLLADTGSGKTLAFLLPVTQLLVRDKHITQALIIVPSRELALQIEQVFKKMRTGFTIVCCYGGQKRCCKGCSFG